MGDFFLDFRPVADRTLARAAEWLRFVEDTRSVVLDLPRFGLVLTYTGDPGLWEPYRSPEGSIAVVAGQLALDEKEWCLAERCPGGGGLAAKAVYRRYAAAGLSGLEEFSGNCAVLIFDSRSEEVHIVTDRVGVFPAFAWEGSAGAAFSSHPDVLAAATGESGNLDEVSVAEFLLTSTVTPPHTYYRRIRAMDHGTVRTYGFGPGGAHLKGSRTYFDCSYRSAEPLSEEALAEELAQAIRTAVRRRTSPRFGPVAIALSGGLDSRAILASVENPHNAFAFCCYNERNRELKVAEAIARAQGVRFMAWQRPFDYYGETARAGVRISGGMGTFANNHFLGMLPRLKDQGTGALLTGCYFDYLFKGLPLNRTSHWLTGREQLAPFRHEFYFSHALRPTPFLPEIRHRLQSRVPPEFQPQDTPEKVFQVEARRSFPLCYEGDNQQRVVPQRVTGWYLPVADREVMEVYRRIPWSYKLNRSVYSKAVHHLCRGPLAKVPDANTGARPGAPLIVEALTSNWARLQRKMRRRSTIATDGSWPDWHYYVRESRLLAELWQRPNARATDLFRRILQPADIRPTPGDYVGKDTFFFVTLLTIKLWCDEWHGP